MPQDTWPKLDEIRVRDLADFLSSKDDYIKLVHMNASRKELSADFVELLELQSREDLRRMHNSSNHTAPEYCAIVCCLGKFFLRPQEAASAA